jgi:hypothetical protein
VETKLIRLFERVTTRPAWQLIEFNDNGSGLLFAALINRTLWELPDSPLRAEVEAPPSFDATARRVAEIVDHEARVGLGPPLLRHFGGVLPAEAVRERVEAQQQVAPLHVVRGGEEAVELGKRLGREPQRRVPGADRLDPSFELRVTVAEAQQRAGLPRRRGRDGRISLCGAAVTPQLLPQHSLRLPEQCLDQVLVPGYQRFRAGHVACMLNRYRSDAEHQERGNS